MALDLTLIYPGQIDTTDPTGYPYGKAKNIVNPGDGTGTPWERQIVNETLGFHQELLARASIVPSGTPDKVGASQYATGVEAIADERVLTTKAIVSPTTAGDRGVYAQAVQAQSAWSTTRPDWVLDSSAGAVWDVMRAHFSNGVLSWGFSAGANLPYSVNIKTVRCYVKQAAAYGSGSRMEMRISTRDATDFDSDIIDTVEAGPGTAIQAIEKTGLSIDLVASDFSASPPPRTDMTVALFAGTGGTPNDDLAYFCEVRFTLVIL